MDIKLAQYNLRIYDEGVNAYKAGHPFSHCPYEAGTDESDQWEDGWFQDYDDSDFGNYYEYEDSADYIDDGSPYDDYDPWDEYLYDDLEEMHNEYG